MPKYEYLVIEKLIKTVVVEARDEEQAEMIMDLVDYDGKLWDMSGAEIERYYELECKGSRMNPDFTIDVFDKVGDEDA